MSYIVDNSCLMADANDINMQALTYFSSGSDKLSITISNLNANTCYIFVVCAHSIRGAGEWTVIANELPPQPSKSTVLTLSSLFCKYYCVIYVLFINFYLKVPLHAHAVMSVTMLSLYLGVLVGVLVILLTVSIIVNINFFLR